MGVFTRVVVVGLMALNHIANCAIIPIAKPHEVVQGASIHDKSAPITTVEVAPESTVFSSVSLQPLYTSTTVHHHSSHHTRSTRSTGSVTTKSSHSSSHHPTRTGKDTTRPPRTPLDISYGHSPVMTEIPRDYEAPLNLEWLEDVEDTDGLLEPLYLGSFSDEYDDTELPPRDYDDGYGYGYGSSTTPAVNGGYGSPPGPTDLPPGGYGDQQPPAIVNPTLVTVLDPVTVTVSLEYYTSSATRSTPAIAAPVIVVTETVTSTPVSHSIEENVTVTVTASKTSSLSLSTTPLVRTGTTLSTEGYVYTTVTASSSSSRTASSTNSIMYTPSVQTPPKPFTNTNASGLTADVDWLLMLSVGALAYMALFVPTVYFALALVAGYMVR
ncbi:hypothetical protein F5Y13DRAFT_179159 [Hypoxylon sp. FL1857]|nr:hypothetical protein F5Y13DRAFT_179159 [Hypoxylon sp. FL1857]